MPPNQRITIRLTPDLAARLAATPGPRGHVADTVRHAIEAYLSGGTPSWQPRQTPLASSGSQRQTLERFSVDCQDLMR